MTTALNIGKARGLALSLALVVALAGCGRKTDLEPPGPAASQTVPAGQAASAAVPAEPPVEDRRFFLDRLID